MKKLLITSLIVIVLFCAAASLFYSPVQSQQRIIDIAISPTVSTNYLETYTVQTEHGPEEISHVTRLCNVTISNLSDSPLLVTGGEWGFWFHVRCMTNGVWWEYSTRSTDPGWGIFPPHQVDTNSQLVIPYGATALKIGLPFAINTWNTVSSRHGVPVFIKKFLVGQDFKSHSKIEWSTEYLINTNSFRLQKVEE